MEIYYYDYDRLKRIVLKYVFHINLLKILHDVSSLIQIFFETIWNMRAQRMCSQSRSCIVICIRLSRWIIRIARRWPTDVIVGDGQN